MNGLSRIFNITYIGSDRFIDVDFTFLLICFLFLFRINSICLMYYSLKLGCLSKSWGGENIVTFSLFNSFKVFISGTKSECRKVLQTILKNRRLCSLLSPFFTPNATPAEFIQLYEKVVKFLSEDNSDMIFMLLTKVSCHSVLMLSLKCRYCCCFPAPSELCLQVNWRLTGRFLI